jgi:autotransporter-associated beta strand protein
MCARSSVFNRRIFAASIFLVAALAPVSRVGGQAFTFLPGNLTYAENFDSMGATGTSFVIGWTSTDASMVAGEGNSTTGSIYNVGSAGSNERAFGSLASGTTIPIFGASFVNATGAPINSLLFSGVMEQWRGGSSATANEVLPFQFSFDATDLTDGTWVALSAFDLVEKLTGSTANVAVDGNLDANRISLSATTNVAWNAGSTMWIRWSDSNDAGNDGLYAIDDFRLSVATASPALYWDLNGTMPGLGGAMGTWNSSTLNWTPDPAGASATQPYNSTNAAHFSGTAGTVQIAPGGIVATGGVTFETEGYVITGGPLTIGAGPVVANHATGVSTITSIIAGSNGLTKTGVGALRLEGANTFTGTITISGGSLRISADNNLGDPANDLIFAGGTLELLSNVTLDVGRALNGAGTITIGSGRTLTVNGLVNFNALALPTAGMLLLAGPTNTIGTLTIAAPTTISGSAPIAVTTGVSASQTSSTTTWNAPLSLPSGTPQFNIPAGPNAVDFVINGIISGIGRLLKVDSGTLRLSANNAGWVGGVRLGVAGTGAAPGGRLVIAHQNALGSAADLQMQFNDGVLEAEGLMTGANAIPIGLSIGPGAIDGAIFAGADMEFAGTVQLFKPGGTTLPHRITVHNHVTFTGAFATSTSTGVSTGVTIAGTGSLTLANSSNPVTEPFTVEQATLVVNGALAASSMNVKSGTLKGRGTVLDLLVGDALDDQAFLAPGNGIGVLTAGNVTFDADATLQFEINSTLGVADQLVANGLVALGNSVATLAVSDLGAGILPVGTSFTIIDNQSNALATTGFFKNRPDLSRFPLNGNQFEIDYGTGSDLNDVVLRVVPEPSCALLLILGGILSPRRARSAM